MKTLILHFIVLLLFTTYSVSGQRLLISPKDSIWTYPIKSYPNRVPLIDSSSVFVGAEGSPVACIDKKTGKEKWKVTVDLSDYTDGFLHNIVEDTKGYIYFIGTSKDIFAVRKTDGKIRWRYPATFNDDLLNNITIHNDSLFFNTAENTFMALSTSGKFLWNADLMSTCVGYTINNDKIYCLLQNGSICVLDKRDGTEIANRKIFKSGDFSLSQPIIIDDIIVVNNKDNNTILGLSKTTLGTKWSLSNFSGVCSENQSVYAYNSSAFERIEPKTGKTIWSISGKYFNWFLQPTEYESVLYLQTRFNFYLINKENGKVVFSSEIEYKSYTKPIVEKTRIYLGYNNNYVAIKNPLTISK